MIKYADIALENNVFVVSGELSFLNVMSVYEKSLSLFALVKEINLDCSQIKSSDSAGLALMIEWVKWAKQQQKNLHIKYFPENLKSIAKAAGLLPVFEAVT